jgi:sensor c-di-GMP phosphodiesterase-like protein
MKARDRQAVAISLAGLAGIGAVLAVLGLYLWRGSVAADEEAVGGLATTLGARTEAMILDTRTLLEGFEALPHRRCGSDHLKALQDAAMSRPHIRAIGYWRAVDRLCGVGFLQATGLRPPRADRIYASGVIAWWPSAETEVGGVQLFLMRFGDHDVAIDPHALLDVGPLEGREAALWVEGLQLTARPAGATLPRPDALPIGLTIDRAGDRAISRYSRGGEIPIEIVAVEPLQVFWERYRTTLLVGALVGLLLLAGWMYGVIRYTRHRMSRTTQLREAIERGRIMTRYQPVMDLASQKCTGAEVLARWTTERGEVVPPESFVNLAEREGLLTALTLAVLRNALRELLPLLRERPGLALNLNLGSEDLHAERFVETLEQELAARALPSNTIKLEITERALVDADLARACITRLRSRGHEVAVDDFGTGYSSLSYLSTFSLDVLKIDKSFVEAIGTGAATSHVIVHVVEMARSLGLSMVAEGVETEAQASWLREHGVESAQGFLYARPLTAEDFVAFVKEHAPA